MARLLGALTAVVLCVGLLIAPGAHAASVSDKVTRTIKVVRDDSAAECRRLQVVAHDVCSAVGGLDVSEQRMADYEGSWVHRALALQRGLDDAAPFLRQLLPHTHNSFNSAAYPVTLTQLDPNQLYSMRDQLRMDIRAIEMDIHKWPPVDNPLDGPDDVVLCHATRVPVGPAIVHAGCSVDRPFTRGLVELRTWLTEPQNAGAVVLLYLENALDGDVTAHERAAADIENVLGPLVYRPADHGAASCAPMPMDVSRAAIRAAGRRVLIVGNCGPGAWGSWVHLRGPQWNESGSGMGDDYPDYPACLAERAALRYDTHLIRRFEDSTWLATMADGTGQGSPGQVTAVETRRMVRCGVNLVGFDQLHPQDPRLAALVWSWAVNEPSASGGPCAAQGRDGRFRSVSCRPRRPRACVDRAGAWKVARRCPSGTTFSVPANGFENERLHEAAVAAGASSVLLAYRNAPGVGWTRQ
ncbi:MAG: hypothetical protein H0W70_05560 [Actinobacteria bacterium]|nr:hypothetical protein [Actinomycetota bacterium]